MLVLINPRSGKRKAWTKYNDLVAPLLRRCNIDTEVRGKVKAIIVIFNIDCLPLVTQKTFFESLACFSFLLFFLLSFYLFILLLLLVLLKLLWRSCFSVADFDFQFQQCKRTKKKTILSVSMDPLFYLWHLYQLLERNVFTCNSTRENDMLVYVTQT